MDKELEATLARVALTIRGLAMDAVQKANSGHPGLPMGCAEIGAYLWGHLMRYNPKDPEWLGRDRFVLSAGHGCMLQYACLHLAGYDVSLEDLKNFRQLHSKTPGHPEFGHTPGIEVTTGPLGQGIGNSVGLALGYKILQSRYPGVFDNKIYCLAGDGCMMEGVSSEVSSLAGHLGLNNLVLLYDANQICLDGPLPETMSEDTIERYRGYGWDVHEIDGNDLNALGDMLPTVIADQKRPVLVVCRTIIGKGSPHKAGTHDAHGSPLGEEEVALTKKELGLPEEDFYVPQAVINFFEERLKKLARVQEEWEAKAPKLESKELPADLEQKLKEIEMKSPLAGRAASYACLQVLGDLLPQLIGGSADLSGSDKTMMKAFPLIAPGDFSGRNIKYGVREFGMATIANGLAQVGPFTPFIGTFLTFSDYMRNAIRLAALSTYQVIYQFTHDSIFLGEDGPTHQPVEHLMALRAIPNLHLIRPGDNNEVKMAWLATLNYHGPSALILSRQGIPDVPGTDKPYAEGMGRGAYILKDGGEKPDFTLMATGSELSLAHNVSLELEKADKQVRLISMPCWELFEKQNADYRNAVLGGDLGKRVSIEAGVDQGWYKYIGRDGIAIAIDGFGASAPASALATEYGYTVEAILEQILT